MPLSPEPSKLTGPWTLPPIIRAGINTNVFESIYTGLSREGPRTEILKMIQADTDCSVVSGAITRTNQTCDGMVWGQPHQVRLAPRFATTGPLRRGQIQHQADRSPLRLHPQGATLLLTLPTQAMASIEITRLHSPRAA